jgi:hypothetical protein
VAVRVPLPPGVKTKLTVQLFPAPTAAFVLQVELDWMAKSFAADPPIVMELSVSEVLPVLLASVTLEAGELAPTFSAPNASEVGLRVTVAPSPVPVRATVWVLFATPLLLSVTVRVPLRAPMADGVNVTVTAHLPGAATEVPQVLVSAKSPALAPPIVMLLTLRAAVPVFERVTVWAGLLVPTAWLAKAGRLDGERLTTGAVPVPVRATVWVLFATPLLLSVTVRVPVRLPIADGVKVTVIVQLALAATELPQVLVSAKFPPIPTLLTLSATVPVFDRVTVCAELVVPTA